MPWPAFNCSAEFRLRIMSKISNLTGPGRESLSLGVTCVADRHLASSHDRPHFAGVQGVPFAS